MTPATRPPASGPAHLQPGRRGRPRLARRRQRLGAPRQPQRHLHRHRDRQPRPRRRRRVHLPRLRALADQRTQATGEEHPAALPGHDPEERGRPLRHRRRAQVRPGSEAALEGTLRGRYRRLVRRRQPAIAIAKASSATACRRAPTCWRRSACTAMRCRRRSTMPTSPACCALSRCISARRTTTARWMWRRRRSSTL